MCVIDRWNGGCVDDRPNANESHRDSDRERQFLVLEPLADEAVNADLLVLSSQTKYHAADNHLIEVVVKATKHENCLSNCDENTKDDKSIAYPKIVKHNSAYQWQNQIWQRIDGIKHRIMCTVHF